jgi:hypothetical protein
MKRTALFATLLFLLLPSGFCVQVKVKTATDLRDRQNPNRVISQVPAGATFDAEQVEGEWLLGVFSHGAGVSRGIIRKDAVLDPEKLSKLEEEYRQRIKIREQQDMLAKGFVKYKGEWVTPEEKKKREEEDFEQEQIAKGFTKFEGAWMRPEERAAIINKRYASEVASLIAVLKDPKAAREQKENAAKRLLEIKEPAAQPLLAELVGSDRAMRGVAAFILGKIGGKEMLQPLIAALEDEDACEGAAAGLGELGSRDAVPDLIKALQDEDAVRTAAEALGKIGDVRAVDSLVKVMQDLYEEDATRIAAATALGMIGDARALDPLKKVMEGDENPLVKEAAREAHDKIKATSALVPAVRGSS